MTTKKKQTRKSVSMPGYVYDAFSVACEAAGVPMAAQNERLVREWLATKTGEVPVAPDKPARVKKEKPARAPKEPKPRKAKAAKKAPKTKRTKAVAPPERVSEEKTEAGVLITYADGTEVEHLDEPTEEMEAAAGMEAERPASYTGVDIGAGPDLSAETTVAIAPPEPDPGEDEDYIDDRMIVVEEDEFIDDGDGVAF